MGHIFLCLVCSSIIVLITAFALAAPSIKSTQPQTEQALLMHLLEDRTSAHQIVQHRHRTGEHR